MNYDLSRLGAQEFEHLTHTLALRLLGPGVKAFRTDLDGRRDAEFVGAFDYPDPVNGIRWSGYGILQAKYGEDNNDFSSARQRRQWFEDAITPELKGWSIQARALARGGS